MDLYYAMTNYHVLCVILHRIVFNRDKKAVLWISSYLVDNQPEVYEGLKRSGFFDDVIVYQEIGFLYFGDMEVDRKMMEEELENIDQNMDKDRVRELSEFDNLYICQDTHSLGLYLNKHRIKYNFFEDGCGILSNKELLLSLVEKIPAVYKLVHELKCIGESENVVHRYGDLSAQAEGYYNKKDVDFSVKKILAELDDDDVRKIFAIYNCKKYDLGKKKRDLLLTWKYANAGLMTLDEQKRFFALLLDYFHDEDAALFIKPHPFDVLPDYEKWFNGAVILERHMPSELLTLAVNGGFDKGITNWSTSIFGLQEILRDVVNFDKDIDVTYCDFHKYFAVVKYLDSIKKKNGVCKLILKGVNKKQLFQLLRYYVDDYSRYYEFADEGKGIYVVDKYDKRLKGKRCIVMSGVGEFIPSGVIAITAKDKEECVFLKDLPDIDLYIEKEMVYSGYKIRIARRSVSEHMEILKEELNRRKFNNSRAKKNSRKKMQELRGEISNYRKQRDVLRAEVDGMLGSISWKVTRPLRKINSLRRKK